MKEIERVNGEIVDIEYIEQKIDEFMEEFIDKFAIEDFRKASQNEWYGCMSYIYRHLFKGTNILKDKNTLTNSGCMLSTCGRYHVG